MQTGKTQLREYLYCWKRTLFNALLASFLLLALLQGLSSCTDQLTMDQKADSGQSPYVSKVFDYQYGPGQHAALVAADAKGNDFIGKPWTAGKSWTSLGGWGGYIVAGFDHSIPNANGPDLAIFTQPSVSSEPGVVYVMKDLNGNGLPDDGAWYEIRGSEYDNPETIRNYEVTYFRPDASGLISWQDNKGRKGTLVPGFSGTSWWWSGYGTKSSVTFTGTRLPDAYRNSSSDPAVELWMPRPGLFRFGYAECYDNQDYNADLKANILDLSMATDPSGHTTGLDKIDFIKVQSGVFQVAGWLNEISTEISGAADIHLLDQITAK